MFVILSEAKDLMRPSVACVGFFALRAQNDMASCHPEKAKPTKDLLRPTVACMGFFALRAQNDKSAAEAAPTKT